VATVALAPSSFTLTPQQTQQLTATLRDAQGNTLSGRTVTWTTDAATVASVSSAGLVTAVSPGTARITATSEGQSASADLTVVDGAQVGSSGGTFAFEDGAVTVTVPAGAVTGSTVLTVTRVDNPVSMAPAGWQRVGPVYALGPSGAAFAKPVTLTLSYDSAKLPVFTMTGDLGVLQSSGGAGQGLTGVVVDVAKHTVSGQTSGLGNAAGAGPALSSRTLMSSVFGAGESGDGSEVAVMVQDPEVSLTPGSASVNSSHRYATFTVGVEARGQGVPLPENTPSLLYRWHSTNQHGGLGIDAPGPNQWTETTSVEYVATSQQLSEMSGEIDRVIADVLLNPASLTDPTAGPQRIVTAEAVVDADLQLTYDIAPQSVTVKQSKTTDLRLRVRDKQGSERTLGADQSVAWETSGNYGQLVGGTTAPTVSYQAKDKFDFPPPRVDRVVMVVKELRRHDGVIREKKAISDPTTGEHYALLEAVDLETTITRGIDTAFVTVEVDYEASLKASKDTVQLGGTVQLTAALDPKEEKVQYRFSSAEAQGKLTPASGTTTESATAQYQADDWATGGKETIRVQILDQSLKQLAEAEVVIEVDPWRAGSFSVLTQDQNCVVPYIIIPKVAGATQYEVLADRFNHPDIGTSFTKIFSGATGGTGVFSVQDGGSSWRIRMEGGGCAISDSARDAMRQAMFTRFAGIRVRFKVTGGP
jgi:hypothetical protein